MLTPAVRAVGGSVLNREMWALYAEADEVFAARSDDIRMAASDVGCFGQVRLQVIELDWAVFAELDRFPVAETDRAVEAAFVELPVEDSIRGQRLAPKRGCDRNPVEAARDSPTADLSQGR